MSEEITPEHITAVCDSLVKEYLKRTGAIKSLQAFEEEKVSGRMQHLFLIHCNSKHISLDRRKDKNAHQSRKWFVHYTDSLLFPEDDGHQLLDRQTPPRLWGELPLGVQAIHPLTLSQTHLPSHTRIWATWVPVACVMTAMWVWSPSSSGKRNRMSRDCILQKPSKRSIIITESI